MQVQGWVGGRKLRMRLSYCFGPQAPWVSIRGLGPAGIGCATGGDFWGTPLGIPLLNRVASFPKAISPRISDTVPWPTGDTWDGDT